jgi:maleate isomerase
MSWRVGLLIRPSGSPTEVDFFMTWRVGLLIPSSNSVMEVDFYRSLPHDTTLHTCRMHLPDHTRAGEERMLTQAVLPAAESLATVLPNIAVFGSTSAADLRSREYDRELCERIGEITGAEPIGVGASVTQALRDAHAARVAVVTPFTTEVNQRLKAGLEADGFEIPAIHGMGLSNADTAAVTPESIYAFVQATLGPRVPAQAVLLAGTNYHAMSALSLLKVAYDVPIVTSNLATLQAVKRKLHELRERDLARARAARTASS